VFEIMVWNPLKLDENAPLNKHFLFWWPVILFVGMGLYLSSPNWCLCLPRVEQYKAIMEFLAFPIFIASVAVPISVVISRFHSSKLAAKANELSEKNNAFNHYFDLKRHFKDYLDIELKKIRNNQSIKIIDTEKLFETIFPKNSWEKTNLTSSIEDVVESYCAWVESLDKNLMNIEIVNHTKKEFNEVARQIGISMLNRAFEKTPIQFNREFIKVAWEDSESPLIHGAEVLYKITLVTGVFAKLSPVQLQKQLTVRKYELFEQVFVPENETLDRFEQIFRVLVQDYGDSLSNADYNKKPH